ncbi:MAG: hypothetical protein KDD55_02415, partial [Bdellovibrionales bacterium]|nr:hypothetical protein [Bdellovibrionales bacterium]
FFVIVQYLPVLRGKCLRSFGTLRAPLLAAFLTEKLRIGLRQEVSARAQCTIRTLPLGPIPPFSTPNKLRTLTVAKPKIQQVRKSLSLVM